MQKLDYLHDPVVFYTKSFGKISTQNFGKILTLIGDL